MSSAELDGLRVYNAQGCTSCHKVGDVGGDVGPDLSRAGRRWEGAEMRRQILTPEDDTMPAYDGLSEQELDELVTYLLSLKE
jgi:mono/diheme cytochrome c family protein